jgi:peroxiredoxin
MSPKAALGLPAPDFELADFSGNSFRLSSRQGEKAIVLVFNRTFL